MSGFGGIERTRLMLARASIDPRNALNGNHHQVLAAFEYHAKRVSLRQFSWEPPKAHRYQDASKRL